MFLVSLLIPYLFYYILLRLGYMAHLEPILQSLGLLADSIRGHRLPMPHLTIWRDGADSEVGDLLELLDIVIIFVSALADHVLSGLA